MELYIIVILKELCEHYSALVECNGTVQCNGSLSWYMLYYLQTFQRSGGCGGKCQRVKFATNYLKFTTRQY